MSTSIQDAPDIDLTAEQITLLLAIARTAVKQGVGGNEQWRPDLHALPDRLHQPGASFVTLYTRGDLHGCIGSVTAILPLAHDVAKNAISAALHDPRFPPLRQDELDDTEIEISILSPMQEIRYNDFDDLIRQIKPGEDGILVERGWQRGLLLHQVWEKLPNPREFLIHVALKAHATPDIYADPDARVYKFQVHHFTQPAPKSQNE